MLCLFMCYMFFIFLSFKYVLCCFMFMFYLCCVFLELDISCCFLIICLPDSSAADSSALQRGVQVRGHWNLMLFVEECDSSPLELSAACSAAALELSAACSAAASFPYSSLTRTRPQFICLLDVFVLICSL